MNQGDSYRRLSPPRFRHGEIISALVSNENIVLSVMQNYNIDRSLGSSNHLRVTEKRSCERPSCLIRVNSYIRYLVPQAGKVWPHRLGSTITALHGDVFAVNTSDSSGQG